MPLAIFISYFGVKAELGIFLRITFKGVLLNSTSALGLVTSCLRTSRSSNSLKSVRLQHDYRLPKDFQNISKYFRNTLIYISTKKVSPVKASTPPIHPLIFESPPAWPNLREFSRPSIQLTVNSVGHKAPLIGSPQTANM